MTNSSAFNIINNDISVFELLEKHPVVIFTKYKDKEFILIPKEEKYSKEMLYRWLADNLEFIDMDKVLGGQMTELMLKSYGCKITYLERKNLEKFLRILIADKIRKDRKLEASRSGKPQWNIKLDVSTYEIEEEIKRLNLGKSVFKLKDMLYE